MEDNEWSDDEIDIKEQPNRDFPPSDSETDSDYEEYNKLILQKFKDKEFSDFSNSFEKPKKKLKEKKEQNNKNKIFIDFSSISEETAKKKWVSKRMENQKIKDGKVIKKVRKFNPRLPIPTKETFIKKIQNANFSVNDFPEL